MRYGDELIPYGIRELSRQRAGRITIHVEPDGQVQVDVPQGVGYSEVRRAISKRAAWIHRHVAAAHRRLALVLPREYVSGESLLYLGRRYRLKLLVRAGQLPSVRLRGGYVEVTGHARSRDLVRSTLRRWYVQRAALVLSSRLNSVIGALRWLAEAPEVRYQVMRRQWGSCSPTGRLTLNPMLVKAPPDCVDYVLLHELCHFKEHNHGRRFYALLDRHMPDWEERKRRLDNLADQILI